MCISTLAVICIIIVLNFVYALGTQVVMDENYNSSSFYMTLWISTMIGLLISYIIVIDIP